MIQPLTPQEKDELNAWIAEHVYHLQVRWDSEFVSGPVVYDEDTNSWFIVNDCAGDWSAAGPLLDRYEFSLEHWLIDNTYHVYDHNGDEIEIGTTGPEAIAKAVRQYEENNVEETIDECIRSIRYALSDDHCISEEAANHLKHYIKQERRAAAEAMRERCAEVVKQQSYMPKRFAWAIVQNMHELSLDERNG